jgi:hypothetical protein
MDGSLLGLGFSHDDGDKNGVVMAQSRGAEGMMQSYMQQCNVYDHEQQTHPTSTGAATGVAPSGSANPYFFVPAQDPEPQQPAWMQTPHYSQIVPPIAPAAASAIPVAPIQDPYYAYTRPTPTAISEHAPFYSPPPPPPPPTLIPTDADLAETARSRAKEIVERFTRDEDRAKEEAEMARSRAMAIVERFQSDHKIDHSKSEYSRKRNEFLEEFENRKHLFLLKNLEYVAQVQGEKLKERLAQIQETQEYERKLEQHHNQILQQRVQRKKGGPPAKFGIGADQQQTRQEKNKYKTNIDDSVAIYVSGLPTDGSVTDGLMRALFGCHGTLRKIHIYINKQTGEPKGDALVIYQLEMDKDRNELVDSVCCQVRSSSMLMT